MNTSSLKLSICGVCCNTHKTRVSRLEASSRSRSHKSHKDCLMVGVEAEACRNEPLNGDGGGKNIYSLVAHEDDRQKRARDSWV